MLKKILHALTILALLAAPVSAAHCGHRAARLAKAPLRAGRLVVKVGKVILPPYRCDR